MGISSHGGGGDGVGDGGSNGLEGGGMDGFGDGGKSGREGGGGAGGGQHMPGMA